MSDRKTGCGLFGAVRWVGMRAVVALGVVVWGGGVGVGCGGRDSPEGLVPRSEAEIARWKEELLQERARKDAAFRDSPTSPMAGVAALESGSPGPVHLIRTGSGLAFSREETPDAVLTFRRTAARAGGGKWRWEDRSAQVTARLGEKVVPPGSVVEPWTTFDLGRFTVVAFPGVGGITVEVYDSERPVFKRFEGLHYFPPDPAYVVVADAVPVNVRFSVSLSTSRNGSKRYYPAVKLRFAVHGLRQELTAYTSSIGSDESSTLFVPFTDATSGSETYGGGRYLDLHDSGGGKVVIDFNRAYNPLCAYSPAFDCPIPPPENRLTVPIRAGEKAWDSHSDD